jgi:thioredoxin reductase (NADPH)
MENKETVYDSIIAGSGPAGLTAAIYNSRALLKTLVVSGVEAGGQLTLTTDVEDYPGFPNGIQGPELIKAMRAQAERLGAEFTSGDVTGVDFKNRPFKIMVGEKIFLAKTFIIATGASALWLNLESEQRLRGRGVSACATCDGAFFKGKTLAVVGGGDTALKDAIFLTKFAPKVYVIHRRNELRAFKALQEKAFANKQIEFIWDTQVTEVLGETTVTGLRLKDNKTQKESNLEVQGLFVAIGHRPNTEFLKGQIELDAQGYVVLHEGNKTNIPGVFGAGDVHDKFYQQAVTAAGAGCMAALEAQQYLEMETSKVSQSEK